jgi:hypothetical protein
LIDWLLLARPLPDAALLINEVEEDEDEMLLLLLLLNLLTVELALAVRFGIINNKLLLTALQLLLLFSV